MTTVLVVCGAGASSTFLASRMRALAASRGLDLVARAASNLDIQNRLPDAAALLVGPHLAGAFGELSAQAAALGVPAALLPETAFGPSGAEQALDLTLSLLTTSPDNEGHPHG
ncbi:PTS sugar transporter subunit IIB [Galbitalea soli]|uniref:PTS sugar transporter subunit IIC n=1 Tax=Galbitalea soli TaxID=1268042 RepID=A0A7C9TPX4_9MICO|nr:PTS sugar transporter subunit IIC [Galbitalea soli]NEM90579.1 PTS sugar transporter subunit IIC [Galbitalea soli]NYJ31295.1 PTS system cellobiose-specific IIB component [Galbitalea soli]